ncbi:MAG: penicillin-binding transpeptidase domain-containing protein [Lentimicrobiaceae bacterium]|nr:penicillin-binding transpeptidase domain-containing protein [Lentimicrobiaceae bacterium]
MSEYKKSFNRRALVVYGITLAFAIGCVIQILNLSIRQRPLFSGDPKYCLDKTQPDWENNPLAKDPNCRCVVTKNDIIPVRGDILDDQGNILASDFTVFDVVIDGRKLRPDTVKTKKGTFVNDTLYVSKSRKISRANKEEVNKFIGELADKFYFHFRHKFPHPKDYYRKRLNEAILEYKNVDILKSNLLSENTLVNSEDTAFIRSLPLLLDNCPKKCLGFPSYFKRIYPYGELAKRFIGTVPPGARSGLELTFDDYLSGINGAQKMLYIDGIRVPSEQFSHPRDGANIHTTLNLRMQNIVYEALMDKLYQMGAQWGCAVVMEVESGEIKAIVNLKKHENERGKTGYFEIFNHAFRQECEPGSTFKLASLLTYLEKVPNDTAKAYLLCGCEIAKHFEKDGKKFRTTCGKVDGALGSRHRFGKPIEIFQRSLNEGTGTMIFDAFNCNYKAYLSALDSMGITQPLVTQLGTVGAPKIIRDTKLMRTFYITTWGGFNMAPIQTLTYFNGVANNGKMMVPKFVSYISEQDKVVEVFPNIVIKEKMTRKDVITRAKKYLEAVVTGPYGTARTYKDSIPHFAGKTGTRDILVEKENGWGYVKNRNSISFCGYFPTEKPKYTMIVYIYDVQGMSAPAVQLFYTIAKRITSLETTDLLQEIDKSEGIKNTQYLNLMR